ncbi:hypothetical protein HAX54_041015 [Datura stramonium]|uniref:Uncharacterized protein n=1 Tax=Datura stramonium TaxID=4076 RepID=A0ABS8SKN3_DATST|nr:hypothetical protein [Datura stramonium]
MPSSRQQDKETAPSSSKNKRKGKVKATLAPANSSGCYHPQVPDMKEYYSYKIRPPLRKTLDLAGLGTTSPTSTCNSMRGIDMFSAAYSTKLLLEFVPNSMPHIKQDKTQ